jgi:hypothetical protein
MAKDAQQVVRLMAPCTMCCLTCGEFICECLCSTLVRLTVILTMELRFRQGQEVQRQKGTSARRGLLWYQDFPVLYREFLENVFKMSLPY